MERDRLISRLREEVRDVKSCFTSFTFQSATLAAVAVGFILSFLKESPFVVLTAIPVIFLLMLVCRVGIFKYTTANRNLGYELHLDRLAAYERLGDPAINARLDRLRAIGWEEALRAWRVVQATLCDRPYSVPANKEHEMSVFDTRGSRPASIRGLAAARALPSGRSRHMSGSWWTGAIGDCQAW